MSQQGRACVIKLKADMCAETGSDSSGYQLSGATCTVTMQGHYQGSELLAERQQELPLLFSGARNISNKIYPLRSPDLAQVFD